MSRHTGVNDLTSVDRRPGRQLCSTAGGGFGLRRRRQPRPDRLQAMRVYLGSDHAGFELKPRLVAHLGGSATTGRLRPGGFDADDDYPLFCWRRRPPTVADPAASAS